MRRPRSSHEIKEIKKLSIIKESEISIRKARPDGIPKVALIYPNSYRLMCSNLGYNRIYQMMIDDGISVHRFFYDPIFQRFRSIDSNIPLDEFSFLFFSISYELDWFNMLDILMRLKIPLLSEERNSHILFVGGAMTVINPNLFIPIADLIFHGEAEEEFPRILDALKNMNMEKDETILDILKKIKDTGVRNVSIPKLNVKFERNGIYKNVLNDPAYSVFTSKFCEFKERFLVEVCRGCFRKCKFCVINNFGYFRPVKVEAIEKVLNKFPKGSKVGLVAPTVNDHPRLSYIIDILEKNGMEFSVSSLRIDKLDEKLLVSLLKSGQRTLTIAPETASQELRYEIGKNIPDEVIFEKMEKAYKIGFRKLKLYFMIGLPKEEFEDIEKIPIFIQRIMNIGFKEIVISLNPFIPKPGTEYENEKMEDESILKKKISYLRSSLSKLSIKLDVESLRQARIQYILSHLSKDKVYEFIKKVNRKSVSYGRSEFIKYFKS